MNKVCTSRHQSLKLIELGINIKTADMDYIPFANNPQEYDCVINVWNNEHEKDWIPAWSLSALLELMPRIEHLKPFIDLGPNLDSEVVSIYYHSEDSPYIVKDNLIDAAFEMVVWLKENGKL